MMKHSMSTRAALGSLRALGPYKLIDERREAGIAIRTEAMPAVLDDQQFIQLRVSRIFPDERDASYRSLLWPVSDAQNPVELAVIARKIIDACYQTPVLQRSLGMRLWEGLSRKRLISHIDDLATGTVTGLGDLRMEASLFETAQQRHLVTLELCRAHERKLTLTLTIPSVKRLREWSLDAPHFH